MAEAGYTPQGARPDVQVTGTGVQNIEIVSGTTTPSGVDFSVPIIFSTWQKDGGKVEMLATAQGIEGVLGRQYVTGARYSEDLDSNGLIAYYMIFTLTYPPPAGSTGPFTTEVQIPIGVLGTDPAIENALVTNLLNQGVAALKKTVAG